MANYGSAPYEESTFKKALRMLTIGAAGWGAVRPGSNFGEAFLSAGGRSSIAAQQASQAAQDYALRQEEVKRRREEDAMQAKFMEAQIKRQEKPEKPEKVEDPEIGALNKELLRARIEATRASAKRAAAGPSGKAPAAPKPREAVLKRIDLINQADPNNPEHRARLQAIISNPATPEERAAALKKLEISPGYYRR